MKKKELLATHMLLYEVSEFVNTVENTPDFSTYNEIDVGPKSVHRQKSAHEEAVFALLEDITNSIDVDEDATPIPA